jgi:hypothetical protein
MFRKIFSSFHWFMSVHGCYFSSIFVFHILAISMLITVKLIQMYNNLKERRIISFFWLLTYMDMSSQVKKRAAFLILRCTFLSSLRNLHYKVKCLTLWQQKKVIFVSFWGSYLNQKASWLQAMNIYFSIMAIHLEILSL